MNKVLFPGIVWFLFLLVPLAIIGFYPTYFSLLLTPLPSIFHIHTFFMVLWIALALLQPLLIQQHKTEMHRKVGRASYLVMPLVFLSIYFMIRHSYFKEFERLGSDLIRTKYNLTTEDIHIYAAAYQIKALISFLWVMTFYTLAIVNRKRIVFHATYMLAAILTLLGPTLDRVISHMLDRFQWPSSVYTEYATFALIISILCVLLVYQKSKGNTIKPAAVALAVYLIGIVGYHFWPMTKSWRHFVEAIM